MTDLITEARELCARYKRQRHIPETMLGKVLELCDALEKAEAKVPRWIPVSEGLPKDNATVLVRWLDDDGDALKDMAFYDTNAGWWFAQYIQAPDDVFHWMPLPEGYEESPIAASMRKERESMTPEKAHKLIMGTGMYNDDGTLKDEFAPEEGAEK